MASPAPARVKEVVLEKPVVIDNPRIFVNPPEIRIGSGKSQLKKIEWHNKTGKTIWIWLPNAHHYLTNDPEDLLKNPRPVENGDTLRVTVKDKPTEGHYPYHIYCEAIENGAEGHSEPHVGCP